ncbi:MAG: YigZ family protein [Firmicutes bacterium]|nr:YigZ family protein [Bacillota bacterium]
MEEIYYAVAAPATHEEKIQRSVFIGHTAPVATEDEARDFIARIRQEHAAATHNCYAYSLGTGDEPLLYYNDHGEPPGTAGRPILNAIRKTGLTNTVVVVTRYFGGKKLGVRGLIDAYHLVALQVLEKAGKTRIVPSFTLILNCDYAQLSPVNRILHTYQAATQETTYGERVSLRLRVPEESREEFFKALSGLAGVSWTETEKK